MESDLSPDHLGLQTRAGFCTVCDFAHARPIMLSILLVIKCGGGKTEAELEGLEEFIT